jgi:uncharacterized membrane protein
MKQGLSLIGGLGLGAGLMYLLDPDRGTRRRAMLRDKFESGLHRAARLGDKASRDLANRTRGAAAEVRGRLRRECPSDVVLAERVRARMGRVVSHPRSIEVEAQDGMVTLTGLVLAHELDDLLAAVARVRGVTGIDNRLEAHEAPGHVPGLQGGGRRPGDRPDLFQENWAPATRLLAGAAGGALMVYGAKRRDLLGAGLGTVGVGLLTRGAINMGMKRLVGADGRCAIDVHKTINVMAPVEQVFEFWTNYENFPRFMSHVREVQDRGEGRSHWVVDGPAGAPVGWDAVVTRLESNELIAWRTEPGSPVQHEGTVRFQPNGDGSTRIDIQMSYTPPAGAVGHTVAALFGTDPKHELAGDLARMKTFIETGIPAHDAAQCGAGVQAAMVES